MRGERGEIVPVEADGAAPRRQDAHDGAHQRRLAGAVAADEAADRAGRHVERARRMMVVAPIATSRASSARLMARPPPARERHMLAGDAAPHLRVGEHLVGRAVGDDAAIDEGQDAGRVARDDVHVVLDEHDGDPLLPQRRHDEVHDLRISPRR